MPPRPVLVLATVMAGSSLISCSFVDDFSEFEFSDAGGADVPSRDVNGRDVSGQDAPSEDGGCCCEAGVSEPCGTTGESGDFLTEGLCQEGVRVCGPDGLWGECQGSVGPDVELCDALDNDCDGETDEGAEMLCWVDGDGDGFGLPDAESIQVCGDCPARHTTREPIPGAQDCADDNPMRHPDMTEVCDRLDSDCSSVELVDPSEDQDDDGFSPIGAACEGGFPATDCQDDLPDVNPGQTGFFGMHRGDGSFDYNCDGDEEQAMSTLGSCSGGCRLTPGWRTTIPACGETAGTVRCEMEEDCRTRAGALTRQTCR